MKAHNGLQREFPALSVAIAPENWQNAAFRRSIAYALHMLSTEQTDCSKAVTTKAHSVVNEERDTAHPRLVTQLLFSFLDTYGTGNERQAITKKMRDNVSWGSARKPWRRSATWLSIKISLQLMLANTSGLDAHKHFKNLMLFLHAHLGRQLLTSQTLIAHDMHIVRAKTAYRAVKLGDSTFVSLQSHVSSCIEGISKLISAEWEEIRSMEDQSLLHVEMCQDVCKYLSLHQSTEHLRRALERYRGGENARVRTFLPDWPTRGFFDSGMVPDTEIFEEAAEGSDIYLLADVEKWIQNDLDSWLSHCSRDEQDCAAIFRLVTGYLNRAIKLYEANARYLNVMRLNILHLFTALDTMCCQLYPLMDSFSPEIPVDHSEPVLLPQASDSKRMKQIERHIAHRHTQGGTEPLPSMFGPLSEDSFQVRYYGSDRSMKRVMKDIKAEAKAAESAKIAEHRELTRLYDTKKEECELLEHDHPNNRRRPRRCDKCRSEKELDEMRIGVFEKPLPSNKAEAKAVCFELRCPQPIRYWRDLVMILLHDIGQPSPSTKQSVKDQLQRYQPLNHHYEGDPGRVGLATTTRSFYNTHFRKLQLPVDKEKVVVNNGLRWSMAFDGAAFADQQPNVTPLHHACALQLPEGCYRSLQYALEDWTHTQNAVIAGQNECPDVLTVHEYEAFASLRSGVSTQWLLMLKNLRASNLNLNTVEVYMLYCQTVWQAGPNAAGTVARDAHIWLNDASFCHRLVDNLAHVHDTIKGNWTEINVMKILVLLLMRMINMSPIFRTSQESGYDPPAPPADANVEFIVGAALCLLRELRRTMKSWTTELQGRLRSEDGQQPDDENRTRRQLLKSALLCQSTFFLEDHVIGRAFFTADLALYVSMAIISHDHSPDIEDAKDALRQSIFAALRGNIAIEEHVAQLVSEDSKAISDGVNDIWDILTFTSEWEFVQADSYRWIRNITDDRQKDCHFNLISGRLTINAQSLQRLPDEYVKDPLYRRVLGNRVLDVCTSSQAGMAYASLRQLHGYTIYFGMDRNNLVIRASLEGHEFEILSDKIWLHDIAAIIVKDTAQWLDLSTAKIEFRPLERMWEPCTKGYVLEFNEQQPKRSWMHQGYTILLDINSDEQMSYANLFRFFENLEYVHITLDHENRLEVHLPRFGFKFFRNDDGVLESQEFSGFKIARDQYIGTLHGLQSKMVLEGLHREAGELQKLCIIPFGDATITSRDGHVQVHVEDGDERRRTYHKYRILKHSNCLQPSDNLLSYSYLAYLHAVTTHPEPDALTMLTGMEASFSLLRQSSMLVTAPHDTQTREVLSRIAQLSPVHSYYPQGLRTMETVKRKDSLPALSQHPAYQLLVNKIIAYNERAAFLFEKPGGPSISKCNYHGELELLERALSIWPYAYPLCAFDTTPPASRGMKYISRESLNGENQSAAHNIIHLIKKRPASFDVDTQLWRRLSALGCVSGFGESLQSPTLTSLLAMEVNHQWGSLLDRCVRASKPRDEFMLCFQFSTIAFGQPKQLGVLRQLLAFAFCDALNSLPTPPAREYRPIDGSIPDEGKVTQIIAKYIVPFDRHLPDPDKRRIRYDADVQQQTALCWEMIRESFPDVDPDFTGVEDVPVLNLDRMRDALRGKWKVWRDNHSLRHFTNQAEDRLSTLRGPKHPAAPLASSVTPPPLQVARHSPVPSLVDAIEENPVRFDRLSSFLSTCQEQICTVVDPNPVGDNPEQNVEEELRGIIQTVRQKHPENPEYLDSLDGSLDALISKDTMGRPGTLAFSPEAINILMTCQEALNAAINMALQRFEKALPLQIGPAHCCDRRVYGRVSTRTCYFKPWICIVGKDYHDPGLLASSTSGHL